MFYYINQLRTPSFSIGRSVFIVRSVDTGLGRWTQGVAVISVDVYPFSQTWPVTLRIWEYMFSGCTVLPDSKETKLRSSDQEASPSAGKNTGVVSVPCSCMEVHPYSYLQWLGYFWGPWLSIVTTDKFSVRVTRITSRIGVSWTHSLTFLF